MQDNELYQQWLNAVENHDFPQANDLYNNIIAANPDFKGINYPMGVWFEEKGIFKEAVVTFKRALQTDAEITPDIYFHLANIHRKQEQLSKAEEYLQKAIEIDPLFFEAHYNLGKVLSSLGKNQEALTSFQTALEVNPQDVETYVNIGVELSNLGLHKEAIKIYEKGLQVDPESPLLYSNLGVEYTSLGRLDKAKELHEKAIAINNFYGDGWYNLACVYALSHDEDKAIAALQKAIKINPENSRYAKQDPELNSIKGRQAFRDLINNE